MTNVTKFIKQLEKEREIRNEYFNQLKEGMVQWVINNEEDYQFVKGYLDNGIPGFFNYMSQLMHGTKFTSEERKTNYEKLQPLIIQLTKNYKVLTQETNKCAQFEGYRNNLERILVIDGVHKKELKQFLRNVDEFILLVHNDFPSDDVDKRMTDWSPVNIPAPQGVFDLHKLRGFKLPDGIIDLLSAYDPRITKYKDKIRIKIGKPEDLYGSSTRYVAEKKTASITIANYIGGLARTITLVHELGHALDMLECEENRLIHSTLDKYLQEYSAIEFEHNFLKRELQETDQKRVRYNLLNGLVNVFFEIDIYTNDTQDFDQAYARAINRCYPKAQQTANPLYVFNKGFIFRPLDGLVYCMAYVECYLKDAQTFKQKPKS